MAPFPSAEKSIAGWAALDGCSTVADTSSPPLHISSVLPGLETTVERFLNCRPGGAAELWTVHGGTHTPAYTSGFPELIWGFLSAHARQQPAPPEPGASGRISASAFGASGAALGIYTGGTVDQLEAAASAAGATGAWVQDRTGAFQLLVVSGPPFLKDAFKARFPSGLASSAALTLTR